MKIENIKFKDKCITPKYADKAYGFLLPNGSIKKFIGRELNWNDEPVKLKEE